MIDKKKKESGLLVQRLDGKKADRGISGEENHYSFVTHVNIFQKTQTIVEHLNTSIFHKATSYPKTDSSHTSVAQYYVQSNKQFH